MAVDGNLLKKQQHQNYFHWIQGLVPEEFGNIHDVTHPNVFSICPNILNICIIIQWITQTWHLKDRFLSPHPHSGQILRL